MYISLRKISERFEKVQKYYCELEASKPMHIRNAPACKPSKVSAT
jgi:hypothetical protein